MTQPTTGLAEFLLDRIVEDEAQARLRMHHAQQNYLMLQEPNLLGRVIPGWGEWPAIEAFAGRVLAECEAKRQIVDEQTSAARWALDPDCQSPEVYRMRAGALLDVLKLLALPYADHPLFDASWRS